MGRLYEAYFADKTVGSKEELNAGKETDKVSRVGIPAAVDSKATRIKNIIQKSSAKKSKATTASTLMESRGSEPKPNADITISISLDKTSLGGGSQLKTDMDSDYDSSTPAKEAMEDKDDTEDMDIMTPMGTKKKKSMANMGSPYASFKHGVYRQAQFGLLNGISKTTQTGPTLKNVQETGSLAGGLTGSLAGGITGSLLGKSLGGYGGMYAGATYNPDIIDPETGEEKKIGLLGRAALVTGGGTLGGLAGAGAGGLVGGSLGAALPNSGAINALRDVSFPAAGQTKNTRTGLLGA